MGILGGFKGFRLCRVFRGLSGSFGLCGFRVLWRSGAKVEDYRAEVRARLALPMTSYA